MQQCNTNTQIIIIFGLKFGLQFRCELQKLQKKKKKRANAAHTVDCNCSYNIVAKTSKTFYTASAITVASQFKIYVMFYFMKSLRSLMLT